MTGPQGMGSAPCITVERLCRVAEVSVHPSIAIGMRRNRGPRRRRSGMRSSVFASLTGITAIAASACCSIVMAGR